ncbi:variable large family protein, partial [Borreliella burgdorferi]|uniref:variable large family protein n=1 Tax=Borreliella burgdorferi TaxID=139 RepID=UPI000D4B08FD
TIFLLTLLVFVNCKNNAGEAAAADDPTNKLYQSIIKLGNGFLDVFTSFGGLVADALGFKADPKKSEVKDYFSSIANKLEETVTNLTKLPKENSSSGGETGKDGTTNDTKSAVESAVGTVSGWIKEMAEAAKKAAEATKDGGNDLIGKVVKKADAGGKTADAGSVNGIADGIKGIVEAAKKSGVDGLKDVQAVSEGEDNKDAGKLFTGKNDACAGAAADAEKAAAAVSGASGEQILKAIVDAAGDGGGGEKTGKKAEDAENPIEAAIGTTKDDAKAFGEKMKKDDQIAAAIVLRGMAKDGQFVLDDDAEGKGKGTVKSAAENAVGTVSGWIKEMAEAAKKAADATKDGGNDLIGKVVKKADAGGKTADAGSVNGIADGIKGIVEAAKKSGVDGLKDVQAVSEEKNKDAGKLFTGKNNAAAAGKAADAEKAAAAVSGVSGEQILKAIVEAAGGGGEKKAGKKAADAENPIDAAIGTTNDDAAAFDKMKKDDQIAAAIVLRGMAKDGQFVLEKDEDGKGKGTVKSAAENAVGTVSGWIKEMAEAAKKAADAAKDGGNDLIGKVVKKDAAAGKTADAGSVNGIADGIKGIVEAAKKSGVDGLKDVQAVSGEDNKDAGKLFTGKKDAATGKAAEAEKAAAAVSGVSGEQILKAIVEAAGGGKAGEKAEDADNPIDAAIGTTNDAAKAFDKGKMKKDDQIAAAIVLRGMAKDGQFVLNEDSAGKGKGTVKSAAENAVGTVSGWIKEMAEAATRRLRRLLKMVVMI